MEFNKLSGYISISIALVFTIASQIIITKLSRITGFSFRPEVIFKYLRNLKFLIALFMVGTTPIFYIYSLQSLELNTAYAIYSSIYALIAIAGRIFLNEELTLSKVIGVLFISSGVFLYAGFE